jgi:cobaltochelatase CobS subunit
MTTNNEYIERFLNLYLTGTGRKVNDKRRSDLRKLCMQRIEEKNWSRDTFLDAFEKTEAFKAGKTPSYSGTFTSLRDLMPNATMIAIATGMQGETCTLEAIAKEKDNHPFALADEAPMGRSKYHLSSFTTNLMGALGSINKSIQEGDFRSDYDAKVRAAASHLVLPSEWETINELEKIIDCVAKEAHTNLITKDTTTTEETKEDTSMEIQNIKSGIEGVDESSRAIIDTLMQKFSLPRLDEVQKNFEVLQAEAKKAASGPAGVTINVELVDSYGGSNKSGDLPDGKTQMVKAYDAFGIKGNGAKMFDFDVPGWTWDAAHPHVPAVDDHYQFEPVSLLRALMAIIKGDMMWIFGHTGTGKSTLVEQICARLQYPLLRVNFDSEITRLDMIGRDTLTVNGQNTTVTKFVEGILPQALQMPCVLLADELDAIRPDVAYVFQRVLEGNGLVMNEDGGRLIRPHPWFRLAATGNSRGNGDSSGMYNAVRPQSMAMLDRFKVWIEVDYMSISSLKKLLGAKYKLKSEVIGTIANYAEEHWRAFKAGDLRQPLSPRGLQAVAEQYQFYSGLMGSKDALDEAIKTAIADRSEESDAQTISGLLQRVNKLS